MSPPKTSGQPAAPAEQEWTRLPPGHLPSPTFWPAGLGLGITFIFWGLISSWVVFAVGVVLFAGSLAGWIAEIRHEHNEPHT